MNIIDKVLLIFLLMNCEVSQTCTTKEPNPEVNAPQVSNQLNETVSNQFNETVSNQRGEIVTIQLHDCRINTSDDTMVTLKYSEFLPMGHPNEILVNTKLNLTTVRIQTVYRTFQSKEELFSLKPPEGNNFRTVHFFPIHAPPGEAVDILFELTYLSCACDGKCPLRNISYTLPVTVVPPPIAIIGETDKPIYRPGEKVSFRFLPLTFQMAMGHEHSTKWPESEISDGQVIPLSKDTLTKIKAPPHFGTIFVQNSAGHRLHEWNNVSPLGALNLTFTILPDTELGEWKIYAISGNRQESLTFQVKYYSSVRLYSPRL